MQVMQYVQANNRIKLAGTKLMSLKIAADKGWRHVIESCDFAGLSETFCVRLYPRRFPTSFFSLNTEVSNTASDIENCAWGVLTSKDDRIQIASIMSVRCDSTG